MPNFIRIDVATNRLLEDKLSSEEYISILDPRGAGEYTGSIICWQIKELFMVILSRLGIKKLPNGIKQMKALK